MKCGANLILLARRIERLEDFASKWSKEYGVKVIPIACDVTSNESIENAVNTVEKEFGKCEVVVNFASGERGTGTPLQNFDKAD